MKSYEWQAAKEACLAMIIALLVLVGGVLLVGILETICEML